MTVFVNFPELSVTQFMWLQMEIICPALMIEIQFLFMVYNSIFLFIGPLNHMGFGSHTCFAIAFSHGFWLKYNERYNYYFYAHFVLSKWVTCSHLLYSPVWAFVPFIPFHTIPVVVLLLLLTAHIELLFAYRRNRDSYCKSVL